MMIHVIRHLLTSFADSPFGIESDVWPQGVLFVLAVAMAQPARSTAAPV
jgi:hypothetical protein